MKTIKVTPVPEQPYWPIPPQSPAFAPEPRIGPFGFMSQQGQYGTNWHLPSLPAARPPIDRTMPDYASGMEELYGPETMGEQPPEQFDLQGEDLTAFIEQVRLQFTRADEGRRNLVAEADKDEKSYNQEPYGREALPFEGALPLRVPAARARVDKASSEIGATFDRDGSPAFGATPLTPSMATIAPHVEAFMHQNITAADGTNTYRVNIHRSFKVGTAFLVSEVVSRPVSGMTDNFMNQFDPSSGYENALVIRSVKMQDMYVLPVGVTDIKDAGFVGERFQMPRWTFNDYQADGFYAVPVDNAGQPVEINNGLASQTHGLSEEHRRLFVDYGNIEDKDPAGMVDLVRAWVRFQPPSAAAQGDRKSKLYYCVFPTKNPSALLRVKENPYSLIDRPPYVPMPVGMGDGTIWGEGWMRLLRSLQHELDTLHMLHIEAQKRAYSRFYLVREDSTLHRKLQARKDGSGVVIGDTPNTPQTMTRIMPDEWFETEHPDGDIKDFSFADQNPGFMYDENRILQYMNAATIDDMPTAGSVRTAFELRNAAAQTAAKLKSYLKTIASKSLKPHIEIVKAQLWEYVMPASMISEYVKFMEYGDVSIPITMTDFFTGVSLDPAGTTTSADETVAITTTASLVQELVPLILNIPGLVQDAPAAVREIVKARAAALGYQKWETLFGLTPPTEADVRKNLMYMALIKQLNSAGQGGSAPNDPMGGIMPGASMGADGGAVMGAPSMGALPQTPGTTGDSQGGSMDGLQPQMAQAMGAPQGANAE